MCAYQRWLGSLREEVVQGMLGGDSMVTAVAVNPRGTETGRRHTCQPKSTSLYDAILLRCHLIFEVREQIPQKDCTHASQRDHPVLTTCLDASPPTFVFEV